MLFNCLIWVSVCSKWLKLIYKEAVCLNRYSYYPLLLKSLGYIQWSKGLCKEWTWKTWILKHYKLPLTKNPQWAHHSSGHILKKKKPTCQRLTAPQFLFLFSFLNKHKVAYESSGKNPLREEVSLSSPFFFMLTRIKCTG